jgi:hypothetical protein
MALCAGGFPGRGLPGPPGMGLPGPDFGSFGMSGPLDSPLMMDMMGESQIIITTRAQRTAADGFILYKCMLKLGHRYWFSGLV